MTRIRWYGPTVALTIVALMFMLIGPGVPRQLAESKDAEILLVRNALDKNNALAELSSAFQQVSEVVEPSVVLITALTHRDLRRQQRPFGRRGFPNRRFGPRQDRRREPNPDPDNLERYNEPRPAGSGSGWVFDKQGHIVTNNHVVTYAPDHKTLVDEIRVRFADGSEYEATVVGTDRKTDIAVLKIDGNNFHAAVLEASPVHQGEIVFAFGSPLGYDFSMSQGIVSAMGRNIGILRERQGYEAFIQTDAAINPGNSGGPLTNIYGHVVGMNTLITSRTGAFSGLGFAIPADILAHVVGQLIEQGVVHRGYLGVRIGELSRELAKTYGYGAKGVLILEPQPGTPAAAAGVKTGDIITKVNDEPVENGDQLRLKIGNMPPGTSVKLTLFRDGKVVTRTLKLMEFPDDQRVAQESQRPDDTNRRTEDRAELILRKIGLDVVRTFTREMAKQFGVKFQDGVLIQSTRPRSIAQSAGLRQRVIITHVMNAKVRTVGELVAALKKQAPGGSVRIRTLSLDERTRKLRTGIVLLELPDK